MRIGRLVSIGLLAILALFSGLPGSAYAAHGNKAPRSLSHFRAKKQNLGPYGGKYLAPKKQHPVKDHYRSPITGNTLYGKPVKH